MGPVVDETLVVVGRDVVLRAGEHGRLQLSVTLPLSGIGMVPRPALNTIVTGCVAVQRKIKH